ncbi:MAG: heparan-alpha-glucosaminide N-acetyltransferase domain-containing protein, partial [Burkholderiaceae bacterium]|nr:heparan-alpha-glucosaminide N-acetyltransferase domain-containing protein [Burkholderiaceae bacterium]
MNNPSDVENHAHTDSKPQLRSTSVIPIRPGIHHHAVHSVSTARLLAIDLLRGLIIVLMALDHTRGFWGSTSFNPTDLAYTTPAWFFTRWITHFCAPLFIVLTGVSAYLYGEKVQSRAALQRYLCSRGIWLIFLEISVINLSWQFAYPSVFLQVIWVIGCSMLMLALLIYLPRTWLLLFSLACIGLHNLLDDTNINQLLGNQHWIWNVLHQKGHIRLAEHGFFIGVTYPLLPWFAVM